MSNLFLRFHCCCGRFENEMKIKIKEFSSCRAELPAVKMMSYMKLEETGGRRRRSNNKALIARKPRAGFHCLVEPPCVGSFLLLGSKSVGFPGELGRH